MNNHELIPVAFINGLQFTRKNNDIYYRVSISGAWAQWTKLTEDEVKQLHNFTKVESNEERNN